MCDPFSAITGALQIAGQCATITLALAQYIKDVATVDRRIREFHDDVDKLQKTYEALQKCCDSDAKIAAAEEADRSAQHLWQHLRITLHDCQNTLESINEILRKINRTTSISKHLQQFWNPPIKQLQVQLYKGELERHHEKIRMFNNSLALPMQMIQITLQLDQRDLSDEYHRDLQQRFIRMQRTMDLLKSNLSELRTTHSSGIPPISRTTTLLSGQKSGADICKNMEDFAQCAKQFLSNASSIASSRSGGSTINLDSPPATKTFSEAGIHLTQRDRNRIDAWVPPVKEEAHSPTVASETSQALISECEDDDSDDEELELEEVQTYFELGQSDLAQENFAHAEDAFTEALNMLQKRDFGDRLAFQSADVILMLTHCYVEQEKLDNAIELLLPLIHGNSLGEDTLQTDGSSLITSTVVSDKRPDLAQKFAIHHSLGTVYLKKQDYESAQRHGDIAFRGRNKLFGAGHEKTIESVQLMVDLYRTQGKRPKTIVWEKRLNPETSDNKLLSSQRRRFSSNAKAESPSNSRPTIAPQPTLTNPSPPVDRCHLRKTSTDSYLIDSHYTRPAPHSSSDDTQTVASISALSPQRTRTHVFKPNLKARFDEVRTIAKVSKNKSWKEAHNILKEYESKPYHILTIRSTELEKNIKTHGNTKGMSATGLGYAPIHFFSELKEECIAEVEILIDGGVDLMAARGRAGYGKGQPMTPLQIAIEMGHQTLSVMMIEALQASGVSATQVMALTDSDGLSPLLAACRSGHVETVTRLLEYGAAVTSAFPRAWCGDSLLHHAASLCDTDLLNLFLSIRTDCNGYRRDIGTINQQDQDGRTPLMYAVISRNLTEQVRLDLKLKRRLACVEAIVMQAGPRLADLFDSLDNQGKNVMDYARDERDNEELLVLLERYCPGNG
ncbi:hypothetical protein R6Q59_010217 [Mikania micrantha]